MVWHYVFSFGWWWGCVGFGVFMGLCILCVFDVVLSSFGWVYFWLVLMLGLCVIWFLFVVTKNSWCPLGVVYQVSLVAVQSLWSDTIIRYKSNEGEEVNLRRSSENDSTWFTPVI